MESDQAYASVKSRLKMLQYLGRLGCKEEQTPTPTSTGPLKTELEKYITILGEKNAYICMCARIELPRFVVIHLLSLFGWCQVRALHG